MDAPKMSNFGINMMTEQGNKIKELLKSRVLLLDGAMGTMIQRYKLTEEDYRGEAFKEHPSDLKGNNDLLSITRADVIKEIHEAYLEAGADILETNTFNSTSISQADYGLESLVYQLNFQSARIASEAALKFSNLTPNKPRFVAGSIGPTNKTTSLSPDVNDPGFRAISFDEMKEAYREQVGGLVDGGVDLLLVETIFDTLNAKAALVGIEEYLASKNISIPVMVSGTITDASGRTLSGQTLEAFMHSLDHAELLAPLDQKRSGLTWERWRPNLHISFQCIPTQDCPINLGNMMKLLPKWLFISKISSILVS